MDSILTKIIDRSIWWGWGEEKYPRHLPKRGWELLKKDFDITGFDQPREEIPAGQVELKQSCLSEEARQDLEKLLGEEYVKTQRLDLLYHAGGKSYIDEFRLRTGEAKHVPDAVLYPGSEEEIQNIFQLAAQHHLAIVPFGGGTSVVGGLEMQKGGFQAVIALDLQRFNKLVHLDRKSQLATMGAGLRGPEMETALQKAGFTLGHYPQSHQEATLGGYVATRSAGQSSTGYGRADNLIRGLRMVSPKGILVLPANCPANAAGPNLRELVAGSEGIFGIVTEVTMEVRRLANAKEHVAVVLPGFKNACNALQEMIQSLGKGIIADVCRLSDVEETRDSLELAGESGEKIKKYLKIRGVKDPCLLIMVFEGGIPKLITQRKKMSRAILRKHGAKWIPNKIARIWEYGRFDGPYLRDVLMAHGVMAETLETATTWTNLENTYEAVRKALIQVARDHSRNMLIQCHISHLYPTGASLGFTFLMKETRDPVATWHEIKTVTGKAIVESGATITHHHGVGQIHVPYVQNDLGGQIGVQALRALKTALDPNGILNPGKLLPEITL